ncbi:MAG: hypothetical protein BGP06_02670 [Rhizobiales bacterium 65-9]|nr:MAG: hypothetical protein BGP06_02670 [Rhizobiales bacterium 65-9]
MSRSCAIAPEAFPLVTELQERAVVSGCALPNAKPPRASAGTARRLQPSFARGRAGRRLSNWF